MKHIVIALGLILCLSAASISQTLLTQQQSLDIARTWMNKSGWAPEVTAQQDYQCLCGLHMVHAYAFSLDDDWICVDRNDGHIRGWDHYVDNQEDLMEDLVNKRNVYQSWAPSHLPAGMMNRLTEMPGCRGWMYRQTNGIAQSDYRLDLGVDSSGNVTGCVIRNCIVPDYTGTIITANQARTNAFVWLSTMYSGISCELTWPYNEPMVIYGLPRRSEMGMIPTYDMICTQNSPDGWSSVFMVIVNAATGEVWDEANDTGSLVSPKPKKQLCLLFHQTTSPQ